MYDSVLRVPVERRGFVAKRFAIELNSGLSCKEYIGPSISFSSIAENVLLIFLESSFMIAANLLFETVLAALDRSSSVKGFPEAYSATSILACSSLVRALLPSS